MKIEINLQSESATKKQQDNAKLLFGAKGKTLVTALDALSKVKKHLDEVHLALVDSAQEFLKTSLDEKTIARLKKRKGFGTLPTRLSKLNKSIVARNKTLEPMQKVVRASRKAAYATAKFITSKKSNKNIEANAKAAWGAKGNRVVADMAKLKPISKDLSEDVYAVYIRVDAFLKSDSDRITAGASKLAKIKDLPKYLSLFAKQSPKLVTAIGKVKEDSKGLTSFTKLLNTETSKAGSTKVGSGMDKSSEKSARDSVKGVKSTRATRAKERLERSQKTTRLWNKESGTTIKAKTVKGFHLGMPISSTVINVDGETYFVHRKVEPEGWVVSYSHTGEAGESGPMRLHRKRGLAVFESAKDLLQHINDGLLSVLPRGKAAKPSFIPSSTPIKDSVKVTSLPAAKKTAKPDTYISRIKGPFKSIVELFIIPSDDNLLSTDEPDNIEIIDLLKKYKLGYTILGSHPSGTTNVEFLGTKPNISKAFRELDFSANDYPITKVDSQVKVGLKTKALPEGIERTLNVQPEFMNSIYKGAGMKTPEDNAGVTTVSAKGNNLQIAERFVNQLRKKPEFKDSIMHVSPDQTVNIAFNDGSGKGISIRPNRTNGKYDLVGIPKVPFADVNTDGKSLYLSPQGLNTFTSIKTPLQAELVSQDSKVKANAKKLINQLDKIEMALEAGMTRQKFKSAFNKLPVDVQDGLTNSLPHLAEFSQY